MQHSDPAAVTGSSAAGIRVGQWLFAGARQRIQLLIDNIIIFQQGIQNGVMGVQEHGGP